MIENISVVIIAKNGEEHIEKCLKSLKSFKEVILYINDTTDDTVKIAKIFSNVNIIDGKFEGFGKTKNTAAKFAKNDWILSLDSDEVLNEEFIKALEEKTLNPNTVYKIYRVNYYKDKEVKYCWGDETIQRLYNKTKTAFTNKDVHEKIIIKKDMKVETLKGKVLHYPYSSIEQFIQKANTYSTLYAKNHAGAKSSSPTKAFFSGCYSFVKTYIFKRGFLDGYVGLVIAFSHAVTNFYKYIKLYELNLEKNKKDLS